MIVLYRGARGTGKTLNMVKDGYKLHLSKWKVYSNFNTNFSEKKENEFFINLTKSSDIYNCVFLIDEIQILFDSRSFATGTNKTFSYFIQQIRKRNIIVLATTQYSNTVDLRFRQNIDIVCFPHYDKDYNIVISEYYNLSSMESNNTFQPTSVKVYWIPTKIFNMYNTFELIQ